jgi:hypothetical protein
LLLLPILQCPYHHWSHAARLLTHQRSRNTFLTKEADHHGFAQWALQKEAKDFFRSLYRRNGGYRAITVYGEWCGKGNALTHFFFTCPPVTSNASSRACARSCRNHEGSGDL